MPEDILKITILFNGSEKQIEIDKHTKIGSILNSYSKEIDKDINELIFYI